MKAIAIVLFTLLMGKGCSGNGAELDLTAISNSGGHTGQGSRISSIEKIDLASDTAANTLSLALRVLS